MGSVQARRLAAALQLAGHAVTNAQGSCCCCVLAKQCFKNGFQLFAVLHLSPAAGLVTAVAVAAAAAALCLWSSMRQVMHLAAALGGWWADEVGLQAFLMSGVTFCCVSHQVAWQGAATFDIATQLS
ncbi:hypothetical protein COO60DRAFT_1507406 [Scenedesmus sp. NREL 46B-D3]|nr:hypothetical protein COO60DRAFT_1507406 [Scenedesmus sp. NREL 46B-D3]